MPIAVPGSGKSTLAHLWTSTGLLEPRGVVCPDVLRAQFTGNAQDFSRDPEVWDRVSRVVYGRLRNGRDTYLDATNLLHSYRLPHYRTARRTGAEIVFLRFPVSMDECRRRNAGRGRVVPDEAMDRMIAQYEQVEWEFLPGRIQDVT